MVQTQNWGVKNIGINFEFILNIFLLINKISKKKKKANKKKKLKE